MWVVRGYKLNEESAGNDEVTFQWGAWVVSMVPLTTPCMMRKWMISKLPHFNVEICVMHAIRSTDVTCVNHVTTSMDVCLRY